MPLYYHGTTQRGLDAILQGTGKGEGPWTCSDQDHMTYLWDASAMMEGEDFEDVEGVIRQAFESAQIQAAVMAEDTTMYVLELHLPAEDVEPDYSCENMHYAVTVHESAVTRAAIVKAYRCAFSKWDAPFVLSSLIGREHFSPSAVKDERLILLAEALSAKEVYREELWDFEWEECPIA